MGDEKLTLVDAERDTGGGENADGVVSDKISNASIDEESSIINKGGDAPGGVPLFAPSSHVGDKFPLAE